MKSRVEEEGRESQVAVLLKATEGRMEDRRREGRETLPRASLLR